MTTRVLVALLIGLTIARDVVLAAEPARDLAQMEVVPGDTVYVRPVNGAEIQARFVRASSQMLVLAMSNGSEVTMGVAEVTRVWKRGDRLRNGAIIGGLVGLLGGIFGQSQCSDCSAEIAVGIGLGVPLWAAVGALIDRERVGRTLIYSAP